MLIQLESRVQALRCMATQADSDEVHQLCEFVSRALLASSADEHPIKGLSESLDLEYLMLYRLLQKWGAYQPRRRNQRLTSRQKRLITERLLQTNKTRREIASEVGVSKGSVDRRAKLLRMRAAAAGGRQAFESRRWRCPVHGEIEFEPCVMCVAEAQRSKR